MSSKIISIPDCSLEQLNVIAAEIASKLIVGDVVCLQGDLGAGKTTFAKAMILALAPDSQEISSPTFNIVHVYDSKNFQIWHFDLYRLKEEREIYNLAIDDAFNYGVSIIEWPEKIRSMLPSDVIDVRLGFTNNSGTRDVTINNDVLLNRVVK